MKLNLRYLTPSLKCQPFPEAAAEEVAGEVSSGGPDVAAEEVAEIEAAAMEAARAEPKVGAELSRSIKVRSTLTFHPASGSAAPCISGGVEGLSSVLSPPRVHGRMSSLPSLQNEVPASSVTTQI